MYIRVDPAELQRTSDLLGDVARALIDAGSGIRESCCCTAPTSLEAYLESEGDVTERELGSLSEGLWWDSRGLAARTAPVAESLPTAASAAWGTDSGNGFSDEPTAGWLAGVSGDGTPGAPFGGDTSGWLAGVSGDGTPGAPFGGDTSGWLRGVTNGAPQGTFPIPSTAPWMTGIGVGTAPAAGAPYTPGATGTSTVIGSSIDPFGNQLVNGVLRGFGMTPTYGGIGATFQPDRAGIVNVLPWESQLGMHESGQVTGIAPATGILGVAY